MRKESSSIDNTPHAVFIIVFVSCPVGTVISLHTWCGYVWEIEGDGKDSLKAVRLSPARPPGLHASLFSDKAN